MIAKRAMWAVCAVMLSGVALAGPKIEVPSTPVVLGEVWHGTLPEFSFPVKNVGDAPLELKSVKAGCSCTNVKAGKQVLAPGEMTTVTGNVKTGTRRPGPFRVAVRITTNDPDQAAVSVPVTATINTFYAVEPQAGLRLRTPDKGKQHEVRGTVTLDVDEPTVLKVGSVTPPTFDVELQELEAGKKYEVIARTKQPLGETAIFARIELTSERSLPGKIELQASVAPQPRVTYSPRALFVPPKSQTRPQMIRIQSFTKEPFEVTSVESSHEVIKVELREQPTVAARTQSTRQGANSLHQVSVLMPDASMLNGEEAQIRIMTTDSQMPEIRVPVTADRGRLRELLIGSRNAARLRAAQATQGAAAPTATSSTVTKAPGAPNQD